MAMPGSGQSAEEEISEQRHWLRVQWRLDGCEPHDRRDAPGDCADDRTQARCKRVLAGLI